MGRLGSGARELISLRLLFAKRDDATGNVRRIVYVAYVNVRRCLVHELQFKVTVYIKCEVIIFPHQLEPEKHQLFGSSPSMLT